MGLADLNDNVFFGMVRKPSEDDIRQAWGRAIQQYDLTSDGPYSPVISNEYLPREDKKMVDAYRDIIRHEVYGARIYGTPGAGLSDSGFGQSQVKSGTRGEEIFAKLLSWDGLLNYCVSYWSMFRPEEDGTIGQGADIDCVLKFGNHILLIDVKNYRSGLEYHTLIPDHAMFCSYPKIRVVAHEPYVFSSNMAWAQRNVERYLRNNGSSCTVESFVVLVPSTMGEAILDGDICWPGHIPAMSYSSFVEMMKRRALADPSYLTLVPDVTAEELWMASLVKHHSSHGVSLIEDPLPVEQWPQPTYDAWRGIGVKPAENNAEQNVSQGAELEGQQHEHRWGGNDDNFGYSNSRGSKRYGKHSVTRGNRGTSGHLIDSLPEMNADYSFDLIRSEDGSIRSMDFAETSGIFVSGAGKSGMSICMSTLIAAVCRSQRFDVHIIDCSANGYLRQYEPGCLTYMHIDDGFDFIESGVSSIELSMRTRRRKLERKGISRFWDNPGESEMKPQLLVVNGSFRLFGTDIPESAAQDVQSFYRKLHSIIKRGKNNGTCVLLVIPQSIGGTPLSHDLVKLANDCTTRLCFFMPDDERKAQVLGELDNPHLHFGATPRIGEGILSQHGTVAGKVQYLNVMSSKLNSMVREGTE